MFGRVRGAQRRASTSGGGGEAGGGGGGGDETDDVVACAASSQTVNTDLAPDAVKANLHAVNEGSGGEPDGALPPAIRSSAAPHAAAR